MSAQPAISHHLLTVNDYHRMADAGIFTEDQPIELINGELFDMAPIGSFHAGLVTPFWLKWLRYSALFEILIF